MTLEKEKKLLTEATPPKVSSKRKYRIIDQFGGIIEE